MSSLLYPRTHGAAIAENSIGNGLKRRRVLLLLLLAGTLLLAACGPKKDTGAGAAKAVEAHPFTRLAPPPQSAREIQKLMELARVDNEIDMALTGLEEMAAMAPPPINEEAAFRRVELMLEFQYPQAVAEADTLLQTYPQHALTPYVHMWLARWWTAQNNDAQALDAFIEVLKHPRLTRELAEEALNNATPIALRAPEREAINWLLTAAEIDTTRQEHWLRAAANKASLASIHALRSEGRLGPEALKTFYMGAARVRLMAGQIDEVRAIADIMSADLPGDAMTRKVEAWASGITQHVVIGALLPLTGEYARFGEEAMRGIRLAISREAYAGSIELRIGDTQSSPDGAVRAYRQLVTSGCEWVIGPLLSQNTEALLPHLKTEVPVISLANQTLAAEASPRLFVHTLAKGIQAAYMAEFAWQQGARKVVLISDNTSATSSEAESFRNSFEKLGGEIVDHLLLEETIDNRPQLEELRESTDDEELLAELDEDIALLSAETELEVRMPVNFDAVYVALPGKRVATLAGQLAYVDISGIPLYGSSRWHDGHLLDDHGRYLSLSRFSHVSFPATDGATLQRMLIAYRETWGAGQPSKLFGMAYDSVLIAAVVGSRLGLTGRDAIDGLHDPEGFPGLTGHVRFSPSGVGHKEFDVYTIRGGKLTPAG